MRLIKNKRITKIMIIELAVILCMVLLSSIRIALIAYLVMIMMFVFDYFRKYIKGFKKYIVYISLIISACLLFSAIQSYSNQIGVTYTKDAENSIERQNILFSIFQDADYLTTHTTFALTYDVLSHFFESPLIGPGLYYVGSGYAGYINFLEVNRSDATLAIYICEFGVIGLLFLLFFYSVFIKTYGSDNRYLLYALITLLIVSVTDNGIFYSCNNVLLLLFVLVGSERVNIINRS